MAKGCKLCNYTGRTAGDTQILSSPSPLHEKLIAKNGKSANMPLTLPVSYRILSWKKCPGFDCRGK